MEEMARMENGRIDEIYTWFILVGREKRYYRCHPAKTFQVMACCKMEIII